MNVSSNNKKIIHIYVYTYSIQKLCTCSKTLKCVGFIRFGGNGGIDNQREVYVRMHLFVVEIFETSQNVTILFDFLSTKSSIWYNSEAHLFE